MSENPIAGAGQPPTQGAPAPVQPTQPAQATQPTETVETTESDFDIGNVKKSYFPPERLTAGNELLQHLIGAGIPLTYNFDPEQPFPSDTHGMLIAPISKRVSGRNVTQGIVVAAIPTLEAVLEHEKGEEFVRSSYLDTCFSRLANAVRPRDDGQSTTHVPLSIEDFIESKRGSDALKAFSTLAPKFVKALKKKGLKYMTGPILKHILESKANAEAQFPKMVQTVWVGVLNKMVEKAVEMQLDPALMQNWLQNRELAAGTQEIEDISLDDLEIETE